MRGDVYFVLAPKAKGGRLPVSALSHHHDMTRHQCRPGGPPHTRPPGIPIPPPASPDHVAGRAATKRRGAQFEGKQPETARQGRGANREATAIRRVVQGGHSPAFSGPSPPSPPAADAYLAHRPVCVCAPRGPVQGRCNLLTDQTPGDGLPTQDASEPHSPMGEPRPPISPCRQCIGPTRTQQQQQQQHRAPREPPLPQTCLRHHITC